MPTLLQLPPEIISRIFEHAEDFVDVAAFASVCKSLQDIWLEFQGSILWTVGNHTLLSFGEALIAARSTEIVKQAYCAGILPPEINLPSLRGRHQKPNLQEIHTVLDLRHLIRCVEYIFWNDYPIGSSWGIISSTTCPPSTALDRQIWKENFHRSFYTYLICGAFLARAYLEPFHAGIQNCPPNFLNAFNELLHFHQTSIDSDEGGAWPPELEPPEVKYFKKFPVYNLNGTKPSVSSFEYLSDWLVQETERRVNTMTDEDPGFKHEYYNTTIKQIQLREVLQILFMYFQFSEFLLGMNKFVSNSDGRMGFSRQRDQNPEKTRPHESTRKVTVILLGIFVPEYISMPEAIPDMSSAPDVLKISAVRLLADRIPRYVPGPQIPDIATILHSMYNNVYTEDLDHAPSPLTAPIFFPYVLSKHFNLKFGDRAFDYDQSASPYELMCSHGEIFHKEYHDGGRSSLLEDISGSYNPVLMREL